MSSDVAVDCNSGNKTVSLSSYIKAISLWSISIGPHKEGTAHKELDKLENKRDRVSTFAAGYTSVHELHIASTLSTFDASFSPSNKTIPARLA